MQNSLLDVTISIKLRSILRAGVAVFAITLLTISVGAEDVPYEQDPDDTTIKRAKQSYFISLDSQFSDEETKSIKLEEYNFPPPPECNEPRVVCHETSSITMVVEKEWRIDEIPPLTSPELTTQEFVDYYPGLPPETIITNSSSLEYRLIVQRTLYERGLLPVLPNGNVNGFQTMMAITRLQHIKGIDEFDHRKGIAYIGPKTVGELNGLKERMGSETYLQDFPLPPFEPSDLAPHLKYSWEYLKDGLENIKITPGEVAEYNQNTDEAENIPVDKGNADGSSLEFDGEAKIQK